MQNRPEVKFFLPRQSSQRLWLTRSDSIWSLKTRCVFVFFLFNCFFLMLLFFDEAGLHIIPQDQMDVFYCCCCSCTCCCCRLIRWYGCCVRRHCCLLSFFSVKANSVKPGFPGKVFHCHFQCSSWSLLIYFTSSNFFSKQIHILQIQFLVYSGFFLAVGVPFFISSLITLFNGGLARIRR